MRRLFLLVACAFMMLGAAPALPDGAHDFDFNLGAWHTHIRRLLHPLSGAHAWVTYDGTVTVRTALGGAANVEEVEANGPEHLELLDVRLYNAASHQWSLNSASSDDGTLQTPATFGGFEHGRGIFYDQEPFNGRMILDRQTFFNITPTSYSFDQAFSDDGGKTWETNFVANLTRTRAMAPSERSQTVTNASHDFDFSYGTWSTHIESYETTGGKAVPTSYVGTVAWRKIWGGRAFLEEIKASNKAGGFEGLTLFLYNPHAHQWSQTFAGKGAGTFDPSMVGSFKNGRGELVSFPVPDNGVLVFAREVWSDIRRDTHHFEIQYSHDGGKTWQPSFVANLTRIGPGL